MSQISLNRYKELYKDKYPDDLIFTMDDLKITQYMNLVIDQIKNEYKFFDTMSDDDKYQSIYFQMKYVIENPDISRRVVAINSGVKSLNVGVSESYNTSDLSNLCYEVKQVIKRYKVRMFVL